MADGGTIPFAPPDVTDAEVDAVVRVLRSGWLTTGSECAALEAELAAYLDVPHVVAVSSCTAAIEIAYASLGLRAGARVGVPTWTFASSALAPHHHGALPVLLDVDPDSLNVSAAALEATLEQGLDAVVLVHFAGVPVGKDVLDLCRRAGVPVIEDAAHALGARDHRGACAGQGSVASCLSFYVTKNLSSVEGGAIVTDREDVAEFARPFRLHGMSKDALDRYKPGHWSQYDLMGPGIKANLPDVLAAMARAQMARFDEMQSRRRELVQRYRANLAAVDGVGFVPAELAVDGADHLAVVAVRSGDERSQVMAALDDAGIGYSVHFQPLHRFGWFQANAEIGTAGIAGAESMADRVLSLPLSSALDVSDVDRVCDVVSSVTR